MKDGEKKIAVISGAAHGIGKASAILISDFVTQLILLDTDLDGLIVTQHEIKEQCKAKDTTDISLFALDVTQEAEVKKVFAEIQRKYSHLNILINAVGGSSFCGNTDARLEEMDLHHWEGLIALNLTSAFLCCREAVPLMKKRNYGRIINFSSIARHGRRDKVSVAYAASKAGIDGFTKKLAREVAPFGITCNAIAAGITLTDRIDEKFWSTRSSEEKHNVLKSIPLQRLATPEEQAQVVVFLASEASSYLTGQIIEVSGGI